MPRRAPIGSICRPSYGTGKWAPYPIVFIQCINLREPMANELWSHGLDGLSRDFQPTSRVDILPGTDREFITKYFTNDRRHIRIIDKSSVNGSVQFTGIPEGWGSSSDIMTYIPNTTITVQTEGGVGMG